MAKRRMSARACSANARGLTKSPLASGARAMESHRKIVSGGRLERGADGSAILRDIGEASGAVSRHIRLCHVAPADLHVAAVGIAQADKRLDELVLAVARNACDTRQSRRFARSGSHGRPRACRKVTRS